MHMDSHGSGGRQQAGSLHGGAWECARLWALFPALHLGSSVQCCNEVSSLMVSLLIASSAFCSFVGL